MGLLVPPLFLRGGLTGGDVNGGAGLEDFGLLSAPLSGLAPRANTFPKIILRVSGGVHFLLASGEGVFFLKSGPRMSAAGTLHVLSVFLKSLGDD